jgi:cell division protein FtsW
VDLKSMIDTRRKGEPDMVLFLTVFVLASIGIIMSYSASSLFAMRAMGDPFFFLKRQLIWFVAGGVGILLFQEIDYRIYAGKTKILLLLALILLVLVIVPGVGHSVKGSSRWLGFGPVGIQPSEFVKVIMVIYLVKVFSSEASENHLVQLLIPVMILAVMFVLIMLQPDFGTAIDLLFVSVMILFVSGFSFFYLLGLSILSIPMFYLLIYQVNYRWSRLLAFMDPWGDRFGNGYHIIQSYIAFRKGGLLGVGLGFGTQKIRRLPEPHTDFIYAVIGEEIGFIGTVAIIFLFLLFFWRGMMIALRTPDSFGKLLAIGLTLLVTVQALINIAVASGSLPTTGIPLPFISYGGSSLLTCMMASGILLNISRYREASPEGVKLSEEVWQ